MDFTPELLAFQGALISADNVHNFSRINSKGGNEEKVNFIINSLKRFLEVKRYVDENGLIETMVPNTRKFVMYIILNTNLPVVQDLMDITELEPFIWSVPTVSQYLMSEIIWQLHMDRFLYELIPNCWPHLGVEVAETFLINFKYFSPIECLNRLSNLCAASYRLICKLTCFDLQSDETDVLTKMYDILQKYLKYYSNPPNSHKLDTLSTNELYKYKGNRLKSMLNIILECFNSFTQGIDFSNDDPLYKSTYSVDYIKMSTSNVCDSSSKAVLECLNNTNTFILNVFQEILMDISVNIFCAWSEYEDDGKTMQQSIGELCHKVQTKLQSINSVSEHPVVAMLQLMARKPTNINDIINTVDTDYILNKINSNSEESESWIHALVNKNDLCQHNALIDIIDSKLNMFNDKECYELFNKIKDSNSDDNDRKEYLIRLTIKLFHKCNVIDKHKILKLHFENRIFFDTVTANHDFNATLTEMFNKFIADANVDFTDVLDVFYQNPGKVYEKIFNLATQNTLLSETMLKVMILLKDYTDFCYSSHTEPCVIKTMKYMFNNSLETNPCNNIIKFICELKNNSVITASQLLLLVIMPGIHEALILKHIRKLHIHVKLLIAAYTMEELIPYRAPTVVSLAQILMIVRKVELGLKAFDLEALETIDTVLKFLKTIIRTHIDQFTDQESSWVRQKLLGLNLHPLNLYYFKSFWNNPEMILFECVTEQPIHRTANFDALGYKLRQVLAWTTLHEWCEIWDSFIAKNIKTKDALRIFHIAMYSITQIINGDRTSNTLASLFYCYRNYMHVIRYKYFTEPLRESQVKFCISLLATILDSVMYEDYNTIDTIIMPLFSYLTVNEIDFNTNVVSYFANSRFMDVVNKFTSVQNMQ